MSLPIVFTLLAVWLKYLKPRHLTQLPLRHPLPPKKQHIVLQPTEALLPFFFVAVPSTLFFFMVQADRQGICFVEKAGGNNDMLKEKCMSDLSCKEAILVRGMRGDDVHLPCLTTADFPLSIHNRGSHLDSQDLIKL